MFIHIRKRMSAPPRANSDVEGGKSDSLSCNVTHVLMEHHQEQIASRAIPEVT